MFEVRGHVDDWRAIAQPTQDAADADGDPDGRALARLSRAGLLVHQGELDEAEALLHAALGLFGDPHRPVLEQHPPDRG